MAMAIGVTASAYAANPFSDVEKGHWAYDSINKLAAAGVIDGYDGANFGGEKLMTRYEMAQIVAKAMAKGANVDKLAAEFADELDNLGVRVAKLEKKVDNVKVTGQIRFTYTDKRHHDNKGSDAAMRNRIFVEGKVNDNWTYTGMLQQTRTIVHDAADTDDNVKLMRAYLDGRLGGLKVRAGHWNEFFINDTILDDMVDGVYGEYGSNNFVQQKTIIFDKCFCTSVRHATVLVSTVSHSERDISYSSKSDWGCLWQFETINPLDFSR